MSEQKIYEVCDSSDDEMYFTLAFLIGSRDEAIAEFKEKCGCKESTYSEWDNDVEVLSLHEHSIGWNGRGHKIMTITRTQSYDEKADMYVWEAA